MRAHRSLAILLLLVWASAPLCTRAESGAGGSTRLPGAAQRQLALQARQIAGLRQQLQQVQEQLLRLAAQNEWLLQQQKLLSGALAEQKRAGQDVNSALPDVTSALPDTSSASSSASSASSAPTAATAGARAFGPGAQPQPFGPGAWDNVRLWGYGEIYYSRPTQDPQHTQADLARGVFGIGYRFDERTQFNSEYEVEHAVASAGDVGEFEIEQFYVDRELGGSAGIRAGLFLMPFGFINEHHEPTNFYGVQRNFVETLIIPSTWREGGVSLNADTPFGLHLSGGVTTGVDLSKWNFAPQFPLYATPLDLEDNDVAPMQATHQELALANARHLAEYGSLNYFGVPGLDVGGAISSGKAVPVPGSSNDPRVTLWEGHVRWTPGSWDLSALYARGTISDAAAVNLAHPGSPNPIPALFYGYFGQAAYSLWQRGEYRLNPFVRWEYYTLGAAFAGTTALVPIGPVPLSAAPGDEGIWPRNHDRVWTAGANLYITPHVVVKADYQWFELNTPFSRFDLGLGLNF